MAGINVGAVVGIGWEGGRSAQCFLAERDRELNQSGAVNLLRWLPGKTWRPGSKGLISSSIFWLRTLEVFMVVRWISRHYIYSNQNKTTATND